MTIFHLIVLTIFVVFLFIKDHMQNELITELQIKMLTKKDNKTKLNKLAKDELYQRLIDICEIACENPFSMEWKREWFRQLLDEVKRIERAGRRAERKKC